MCLQYVQVTDALVEAHLSTNINTYEAIEEANKKISRNSNSDLVCSFCLCKFVFICIFISAVIVCSVVPFLICISICKYALSMSSK